MAKKKTSTVNLSFQTDLLDKIDRVARQESRTRSELIREAARSYIENKEKWKRVFDFAENQALNTGLKKEDIAREIVAYRKSKSRSS